MPLPGDDLSLSLCLRAGAQATLRATGASLAQGRGSRSATALSFRVDFAEGASPVAARGPLVVCRVSRMDVRLKLTLGAGAAVEWHEMIVLGCTREPSGQVTLRWDVSRADRPVLRQSATCPTRRWRAFPPGRRVLACALSIDPATTPPTVVARPAAMAPAGRR